MFYAVKIVIQKTNVEAFVRDFVKRIQIVDDIAIALVVTRCCTLPSCPIHTTSCIASSTLETCGKLGMSPT